MQQNAQQICHERQHKPLAYQTYKKGTGTVKHPSNELGFEQEKRRGKKLNQKLKPYLVLQILMEHTDEEHVLCADKIVDYLGDYGIYAERRSIYTDIERS